MKWVLVKGCLCHPRLPGAEVEHWFLTQEIVGSSTTFYKNILQKFCRFYRIHLGKTRFGVLMSPELYSKFTSA